MEKKIGPSGYEERFTHDEIRKLACIADASYSFQTEKGEQAMCLESECAEDLIKTTLNEEEILVSLGMELW